MSVNNAFGCVAGYVLYDCGKVTGSCFVISEYGKQYIAEKDKCMNGPFNLFKVLELPQH